MRIETITLPYYPVMSYVDVSDRIKSSLDKINLNQVRDVLLIVDDHTRPNTVVHHITLNWLIRILGEERVAVLVASGLHRASSHQEIEDKLGSNIKKVRLYTHNPMTTPSSFLGGEYFRIGINVVLPHLHTTFSSCGKLICPGLKNYNHVKEFHSVPSSIAQIAMVSHQCDFDIGFDVYVNSDGLVVDVVEQDPLKQKVQKEYYTVDMPELGDVAVLIPSIKKNDFQQSMNVVNLMKYSPLVKQGGLIAISGDMPEGIGVHYLFQNPNGIRPVKYDEAFSAYFYHKSIAVVSENLNYKSVQEYFNSNILFFNHMSEFESYAEFLYGKDVRVNYFIGADIMIGRSNEQPSV